MTAPPDVVFVADDGALYDATAAGWSPTKDVHPLAGLCGPQYQPLTHKPACRMADWPDLADICTCTAALRWLRAQNHPH